MTFFFRIQVKYHHLDHEPFSYIINIENSTGATKHATIRIFLGPKYDELGNRLEPDDQRRLMIELDKFHKERKPHFLLCVCVFCDEILVINEKITRTMSCHLSCHKLYYS